MVKKTFTYTDFNGKERTEDAYFNINKAELLEMNMGDSRSVGVLAKGVREFILTAYGEKSLDGRRFEKKDGELAKAWAETPMFEMLYEELTSNEAAAIEFVKGVVPADVAQNLTGIRFSN